jgi:hypothetical protein
MNTIKLPTNLKMLKNMLPKSNYKKKSNDKEN